MASTNTYQPNFCKDISRGFSLDEYQMRVQKLVQKMYAQQLDAVVLTSPQNFEYFSGYQSDFWLSPTRPWFLIISNKAEVSAVIPEIGVSAMNNTIIEKIESWPAPRPKDDGISLLQHSLSSICQGSHKVGWEMGAEMTIRMPIADFDSLRKQLSGIEFVDASATLWQIRSIKSVAEIIHITQACQIASMAFDEMLSNLKLGDSENIASRKLRLSLINNGADNVPFVSACSDKQGYHQIISGNGDRLIEDGSVLFLDTGATWDSYFCDFNRNFGFGKINDEVKQAYSKVYNAIEDGLKSARAGMTCRQLCEIMLKSMGMDHTNGSSVGRLGHGLGMQLTEPPSFSLNDETVLQENMVMTLEPGFEFQPQKMLVLEENIVIHQDGCELLSKRAPQALSIIN